MDAYRRLLLVALLALALAGWPSDGRAQTSAACLVCHQQKSLSMEKDGKPFSLHTDKDVLARSAHKGLDCIACHAGFDPEETPHREKIEPVNCRTCHGDTPAKHAFHPQLAESTEEDAASGTSCKQCHGTHAIPTTKDPEWRFSHVRMGESCGACHQSVVAQFRASEHGKALAAKMPGAPDCLTCHVKPMTRARWQGDLAVLKVAQEKVCLSCHLDDPGVRARMAPGMGFIAAYEKSVHGAALLKGDAKAANCVDCHGSHEMKRGSDPTARVSRARIPETCATCHADIAKEYADSAHAKALAKGNASSPVCTTCHGEHNILDHTDPRAPVASANVSATVCSPCHSSVTLAEKYGIASDRFQTFSDSFHGLAIRGGSVAAANCASCHGAHAIKPSSDPTSTVHPANMANTCGQCHPGANERFAIGKVHVTNGEADQPILYWISFAYVVLIVFVVGGMTLHNALDFVVKARRQLAIRRGQIEEPPAGTEVYPRMSLGERLQHGTLALSFIALVVTGFMLRYPEALWVQAIRGLSPHAFELRGLVHRIAAVAMVAASLYHLGYVTLTARGRRFVVDMWPRPGDLGDFWTQVKYYLGRSKERARFGRFGYVEKAEYWALVWGTFVMVATGIIMWFENTFIGLFTKLGWDVARTVHFWEAWLATLAIVVWHFYFVIFNPDVYPMNTAWFTGTLSEKEMAEEHPLELEAIRRQRALQAAGGGEAANPSETSGSSRVNE